MKILRLMTAATITLCLVGLPRTQGAEKSEEQLQTEVLGGVTCPSAEELAAMQNGQFILRARDGRLTKVPVQKNGLPHDPKGHIQRVWTAQSPLDRNIVYVNQGSLFCKTIDGGKTWTSYQRDWPGDDTGPFQILGDGSFITVTAERDEVTAVVWSSSDEGRTWQQISEINMPAQPKPFVCLWTFGIFRLQNKTLLCGVLASDAKSDEHGKAIDGSKSRLLAYRSTDDGQNWQGANTIADWTGEGGIVRTASGKLLAVLRYQTPLLPGNAPDLLKKTGGHSTYKHLFLASSDDGGRIWKNFRQLTTVFGQSYGFPAALSDGTVVVVRHDGYNPNRNGLAMISYNEGETWEDEAYYMYAPGNAASEGHAGYAQNVVLADDLILTIAGTCDFGPCRDSWDACLGKSDLTAIRWKPERK